MNILELAEKALKYNLCNHCLGRQFAKLGHGFSNQERGKAIRTVLMLQYPEKKDNYEIKEKCWLCENLFNQIEKFAKLVIEKINNLEFNSFLIGSKIDTEIQEREEILWSEITSKFTEPIKSELNREIGKEVFKRIGKDVDFVRPEILAIVDTRFEVVKIIISSLFIYGKYKKLIRGIPQTKWPCRRCFGKGCEKCGWKGKLYETSVEEIIAKEVMSSTNGEEHLFHGMGREDIDVRMLGNGRPFVLEIRNPKKRILDLKDLEKKINEFGKGRVEVNNLRFSNKKEVIALKKASLPKTYHVKIKLGKVLDKQKINEAVNTLKGKTVVQRTPSRVVRRRADKIRKRKIINIQIKRFENKEVEVEIKTESGTYIKELINGDCKRTKPNLSELLGMECEVMELDVIDIGE